MASHGFRSFTYCVIKLPTKCNIVKCCKTFCACWNITAALPATVTLRYSGISQPLCTLRGLPAALRTSHSCLEFPMDTMKYDSVVPNISSLKSINPWGKDPARMPENPFCPKLSLNNLAEGGISSHFKVRVDAGENITISIPIHYTGGTPSEKTPWEKNS